MDELLLPYMNNNWDATADFFDLDDDGVVTRAELDTAVYTDENEHGLNFWRIMVARR